MTIAVMASSAYATRRSEGLMLRLHEVRTLEELERFLRDILPGDVTTALEHEFFIAARRIFRSR